MRSSWWRFTQPAKASTRKCRAWGMAGGYMAQTRPSPTLSRGFTRLGRFLAPYEVCRTPLLDVTHSIRIAASFASSRKAGVEAFVFVLGVPHLGGAITASSEASLHVVRLSSACPPSAVRPHLQEGYLLGEYPEIADYEQNLKYPHYEMDFGRRLVAKFRFDPTTFWKSKDFPRVPREALYPKEIGDTLLDIAEEVKAHIGSTE